jgi:hypothetical protein
MTRWKSIKSLVPVVALERVMEASYMLHSDVAVRVLFWATIQFMDLPAH